MSGERNEMRELVFREIVKSANTNPGFKAIVEPLGFFTFMELIDGIVDAVFRASSTTGDPNAQ